MGEPDEAEPQAWVCGGVKNDLHFNILIRVLGIDACLTKTSGKKKRRNKLKVQSVCSCIDFLEVVNASMFGVW